MPAARTSMRVWRAARANTSKRIEKPAVRRQFAADNHHPQPPLKFQSTSQGSDIEHRRALAPNHWASALTGGGIVFAVGLLWYTLFTDNSPSHALGFDQARSSADSGAHDFKLNIRQITPGPTDEVIRALKDVAESQAPWVPGGREYVEKCFGRLQEIRKAHEQEVNNIARDTYDELRAVASKKSTTSLDRVNETWYILSRRMDQLLRLAGDQAQQVIDQYPELRDELNGTLNKLRKLGDHLGPGAKKQVDETFDQMTEIVKQGIDQGTGEKLKKLVQNRTRELSWRRERAWQTAEEQIEPLLRRNPHVRQIFEQNLEILHQGRAKDVVDKVQQAVLTGSTGELERYIQSMARRSQEKANQSLSNWLSREQDGSRILASLQKLKDVAETKNQAGDQLAKLALSEVSNILDSRTAQVERLRQSWNDHQSH